jgi:antitoxin YefM
LLFLGKNELESGGKGPGALQVRDWTQPRVVATFEHGRKREGIMQQAAAVLVSGELSEETAVLVERAQATRRPVSVTAAGDEVAVLLDARDFREMQERLALLQAICRAQVEIADGQGIPQEVARARALAALDR